MESGGSRLNGGYFHRPCLRYEVCHHADSPRTSTTPRTPTRCSPFNLVTLGGPPLGSSESSARLVASPFDVSNSASRRSAARFNDASPLQNGERMSHFGSRRGFCT